MFSLAPFQLFGCPSTHSQDLIRQSTADCKRSVTQHSPNVSQKLSFAFRVRLATALHLKKLHAKWFSILQKSLVDFDQEIYVRSWFVDGSSSKQSLEGSRESEILCKRKTSPFLIKHKSIWIRAEHRERLNSRFLTSPACLEMFFFWSANVHEHIYRAKQANTTFGGYPSTFFFLVCEWQKLQGWSEF